MTTEPRCIHEAGLRHVSIEVGGPGYGTSVMVDGASIGGAVREATLHLGTSAMSRELRLDMQIQGRSLTVEGPMRVALSDATRAALLQLGWQPPVIGVAPPVCTVEPRLFSTVCDLRGGGDFWRRTIDGWYALVTTAVTPLGPFSWEALLARVGQVVLVQSGPSVVHPIPGDAS